MAGFQKIEQRTIAGPDFFLEEPPRLLHPHPAAIGLLDNRLLWRYLEAAKYISLLTESSLYFVRADRLSEMDPMERSWGQPNIDEHRGEPSEAEWARVRRSLYNSMGRYYLNCWHLNRYESAAMWRLYGASQSIAVRTTLAQICATFSHDDAMDALAWRVLPLEVKYIDHNAEAVSEENAMHLLSTKRRSYEYENEIRFALIPPADVNSSMVTGIYLRIDLCKVLEAILISPDSASWFTKAIAVVTERFGVPRDRVKQSALGEGPIL